MSKCRGRSSELLFNEINCQLVSTEICVNNKFYFGFCLIELFVYPSSVTVSLHDNFKVV